MNPCATQDEADLTFWLSYRKGETERFMPPMSAVKDLYYKKPLWYPFRFTLTSQQTLEFRQTATRSFKMVTLSSVIISTTGAAPFYSAQVYDVGRRRTCSRLPVWGGNFAGSAQQRYWNRAPYLFRAGNTILVQLHNWTADNLTAEFVMEGIEVNG